MIDIIPHGVPDIPLERLANKNSSYFPIDQKILFTCGLLHQGKGIQFIIQVIYIYIYVYIYIYIYIYT